MVKSPVRNKFSKQQQIIRMYFSKLISNRKYNIRKCLDKWAEIGGDGRNGYYGIEENPWFGRGAVILAKYTKINIQKSLWRLDPRKKMPKACRKMVVRYINSTVLPDTIIVKNRFS